MGKIAEDMIRLVQEIRAGHAGRKAYTRNLRVSVAQMRAGFRSAHAQMARESMIARREIVNDLLAIRRAWMGLGPGAGSTAERVAAQIQAEAAESVVSVTAAERTSERGRGRRKS